MPVCFSHKNIFGAKEVDFRATYSTGLSAATVISITAPYMLIAMSGAVSTADCLEHLIFTLFSDLATTRRWRVPRKAPSRHSHKLNYFTIEIPKNDYRHGTKYWVCFIGIFARYTLTYNHQLMDGCRSQEITDFRFHILFAPGWLSRCGALYMRLECEAVTLSAA